MSKHNLPSAEPPIDTSDIPEADETFFQNAQLRNYAAGAAMAAGTEMIEQISKEDWGTRDASDELAIVGKREPFAASTEPKWDGCNKKVKP